MTYETIDVSLPDGLAKRHRSFKERDCGRCGEKIIPPEDYYAIWRGEGSAPKECIHIKCLSKETKIEK